MSNKSRNRQRKSRVDRLEQGTQARTDHLLDRVSAIENTTVRLHGARCPCGSVEVVSTAYFPIPAFQDLPNAYRAGEIRCFYCHKLLEAYGVRE